MFYNKHFFYKNNILHCDNINLLKFNSATKTPCYIYNKNAIQEAYNHINDSITHENKIICYAMKACHNDNILRILKNLNSGVDCVSEGEMKKALKIGFDPNKIIFSASAKTDQSIKFSIKQDILQINVESFYEIEQIDKIAKKLNTTQKIGIRIKPNIKINTHKKISTGHSESKFGISIDQISKEKLQWIQKFRHVKLCGFSVHIGSQIFNLEEYQLAYEKLINITNIAIDMNFDIQTIDFGGGFGVQYKNKHKAFNFKEYNAIVLNVSKKLKKNNLQYIFEPGRFVIANSAILIAKVLCIKEDYHKKYAILNTGMNSMIRVALYNAYHDILPIKRSNKSDKYDICGIICESSDFFAKNRKISELKIGDLIAIMSCGAYGSSMASQYNLHKIPREIII